MTSTDGSVLRQLDEGVLVLTLNRPDRHNAWTPQMEEEYFDALEEAAADTRVRAIVVTGAGRSFCPGMDMDLLARNALGERSDARRRRPMTFPRLIPKPIIAAVNGACAGIGVIQACCADLRFASRGAKIATSFARRGLPAENSLAWILPRMVGAGVAADLLLSGRTILAEEAHALGLVERLCEPEKVLDDARSYALDLARNCSPLSMATIKRQLLADWERTAEESREASVALVEEMRELEDFREGTMSFIEKRPPRFAGLSTKTDEG